MARFVIVGTDNQSGLLRSGRLLASAIRASGHEVTIRDFSDDARQERPDVVVFLERIVPPWLTSGAKTVLVPNQEWFDDHALLGHVDAVWCKTRYARALFEAHHPKVRYIGFTSDDRLDPSVERDWRSVLHVAGRSQQKGTSVVLEVWRRHPEWPTLTVIRNPETPIPVVGANLHPVSDHLPDEDLRWHENHHGVHLCPSEAEGFGHSMVQAMSCGAAVLTTDGPPMNELVTAERGILVPARRSGRQRLGTNWYVGPDDLERAVQGALALPDDRLRSLGVRARHWYDANDRALARRVEQAISALRSTGAAHR